MPIRNRETTSEYFERMRDRWWKLETAKKREEYDKGKESTVKATQAEAGQSERIGKASIGSERNDSYSARKNAKPS